MNIMPIDVPGPHKQGTLTGYSSAEIEKILGFPPNIKDDPDKVKYSWGFLADGQQCGIWDYKGSHKDNYFSAYGPKEVFEKLFPTKE